MQSTAHAHGHGIICRWPAAQKLMLQPQVNVRRRPWNDAEDEMARKRLHDLTGSDADMAALAAQQQLGLAAAQEAANDPGEVDVG